MTHMHKNSFFNNDFIEKDGFGGVTLEFWDVAHLPYTYYNPPPPQAFAMKLCSHKLAKLIIATDCNYAMHLVHPKSKFIAKRRKGNDISMKPKELQLMVENVLEAHNYGKEKRTCKELNDITKWIRNYLQVEYEW